MVNNVSTRSYSHEDRSTDLPARPVKEVADTMDFDQQDEIILVVDDSLEIRGFVKALLEHAGYAVATAADGEDGLNVFRRHRSRIALLLTDVKMPKMNGLDLADRVLELDSQVPVLFMSGDAWNPTH